MNKKIKKNLIIIVISIIVISIIFAISVLLYLNRVSEKLSCRMSNWNWKTFSNGCADKCNSSTGVVMCTMSFSDWCNCWKNKCWTWNKCVEDIWSKKREEILEKISKCYDDNWYDNIKCYKEENYSNY